MNSDIFDDSAFDCLDTELKNKLMDLSRKAESMEGEGKLIYILKELGNIQKTINITASQKRAMLKAVLSDMPENERNRLNVLFRFNLL